MIDKNKRIKVVVTDYIEQDLEWEVQKLSDAPVDFQFYQLKHATSEQLIEMVRDATIIIVNMAAFTREVLKSLNNCKLIIRHGAGYDNVDIECATEYGIQVCYVPDYCREEVAEQAMMLILSCYRKFVNQLNCFEASVQKGQWDFSKVIPINRLSYRTVGIVGCGRIGSIVLQMLRGFNMKVLVCDPFLSERRQQELGIKCLPLEEVLSQSDVITCHPSLNKLTYHFIGERELRMMKPTAILVNTSRGSIVDADGLAKACKEGWIAGAGIDVYEKEPPAQDFVLRNIPNIILTPHLAWYSEDAGWSIREKIVEDVIRFIKGDQPRYPINLLAEK
jgi:D-3-phosphoglycerate dehydrogenase